MVGHFFKIASFYLIYRIIIITGLRKRYALMFKDLKQGETELKKSEAFLSAFTHALPDISFIYDEDGTSVRVFSGNDQLLFMPPEELVGKQIISWN